jgi:hypothetical protein
MTKCYSGVAAMTKSRGEKEKQGQKRDLIAHRTGEKHCAGVSGRYIEVDKRHTHDAQKQTSKIGMSQRRRNEGISVFSQ